LYGHKSTGTPVEILLLEERSAEHWLALVKPGKRLKVGSEITFYPSQTQDSTLTLTAKVLERDPETGGRILQFFPSSGFSFWDVLDQFGQMPFPPYVTESEAKPEQYQTIYANEPGAVAAPTAGLHFTDILLQKLAEKGIQTAQITLHVGVGTFRPVEVENISEHTMHQEWIEVPEITVEKIRETQAKGGRIIAVGTTSVRALEGAAQASSPESLTAYRGETNMFIYPGYQWQIVDGLITNFHLMVHIPFFHYYQFNSIHFIKYFNF
jgi:S-adenosylmethionine:tRNA ribosyltransferase-isomerase